MNTVRRIVKNSGASLLMQVSTPASSFLLVYFIARFLGASGLGTFSSALSMLFMFQAFVSLGFQHLITREVAQDKSKTDKLLVNASFIGGIFSILMAVVMCLTANLITDDVDIIHSVYVLSISLIPFLLTIVCQSISWGFEKIEYIAISQITGNAFKLLTGLYILLKGYGVGALMIVILVSHFLICGISLYFALKCMNKILFRLDFDFCRWIIKATPIFALILVFSAVRQNVDILVLTNMMGPTEVGLYSAAYKLMNICQLGVSCYIIAVQPVIFRLFISSREKFEIVCEDSIRYLLILTIPIVVGTLLLSNRFILIIFNDEFIPSANVLRIVIFLLILSSFDKIFTNALIAGNLQKVNMSANLVSMVCNICLNLLLIPYVGFIGAGIAKFVSAFIILIYQYYFVSKSLFKVNFKFLILKPFVAAALMAIFIVLLKDINLFLLIVISAIIYILTLLALKPFSAKEKELLLKLWKGEKALGVS